MKSTLQLLMLVSSVAVATAAPLSNAEVSSDAKWLTHVDLDQLRSTKLGGFLINGVVQPKLNAVFARLKEKIRFEFDSEKILSQINSITAYGTGYDSAKDDSVILIHTDGEVQQVIVGALAALSLSGTNGPAQFTQSQVGNVTFYDFQGKGLIGIVPGKVIVVGKSRAITERAANVIAGKSPNLGSAQTFSGYAEIKHAFFFLAVAEGFSEGPQLPPQAQVLRMADGARIAIGENADLLSLNLALKAKTSEVVTQMQQVVQGVIALGALGKPEDKDLAQLVQSVKVSTERNTVNVSLDYPVQKLIERISGKIAMKIAEEKKE